ncbi:MAG: hypothetical protein JXK05_13070 [Campylobacterales bacterium]|nr:hypothetical protein [Campylobacterales bacterium]
MRKIGFASSKSKTLEIMPKSYQVEGLCERRRMFFAMFNDFLPPSMQIPLKDRTLFRKDIRTILHERIMGGFVLKVPRIERAQRVVCIYAAETPLLMQYFKQCTTPRERYLARDWEFEREFSVLTGYAHPAAEVVALMFDGREVALMCDLDTLFAQTVYRRIPRQKNTKVSFDAPYIHVDEEGRRTRLYPRWRQVDPKNIAQRKPHLEAAFEQLEKEPIDALYLVYPKSERFTRHITVQKSPSLEVKMIPYSFTFANRKEKSCQK